MDKNTRHVLKLIDKTRKEINFLLDRLGADIEGIYQVEVFPRPVEANKGVLDQDKIPF